MKRLMFVFGTRPEFIKIYPVYMAALKEGNAAILVSTGQHKEMLNPLLEYFNVKVDYDLEIMDISNGLVDILCNSLKGLETVMKNETVDMILVHGDTSATLAGSLIAYYNKIPLCHIEAGLRTFDKFSPFPEEINRKLTGAMTDYHFSPTNISKQNLLNEGVKEEQIFVVGNSAIDMLKYTVTDDYDHEVLNWEEDKKLVLITAHRRENIDELDGIFSAIDELANTYYDDYKFVYPIHLNPIIREKASNFFKNDNIRLVEPLDTIDFHNVMSNSYLIMTDSGGIQEEAPSLGIPVLVLRNVTERPEGVEVGTLKLVGTNKDDIVREASKLLSDKEAYAQMSNVSNPYGDGTTSKQIMDIINNKI